MFDAIATDDEVVAKSLTGTDTVSVVIPIYNGRETLGRAIDSVLRQTHSPSEIIVVDDSSNDGLSKSLVHALSPTVIYLRHPRNRGAAAARNTGINAASANFIAFLDSDDEWLPDKLECQLSRMEALGPGTDVTFTSFFYRGLGCSVAQVRNAETREITMADLAFGCGLSPGSTMMVRQSVFDVVGPFDETLPRLEDWEWLLRAANNDRVRQFNIGQPLARINVQSWPNVDAVRGSVDAMRRSCNSICYANGFRTFCKFQSALMVEHAVAVFRNGGHIRGAAMYFWAICLYPVRSPWTFRRMVRGAKEYFGWRRALTARHTARKETAIAFNTTKST
jgi:glycosyltransferase involved in cell wall biosynthesis